MQTYAMDKQESRPAKMLFDDVLRKIGEFGPYQIALYFLFGLLGLPAGFQSVGIAFLGLSVDHWCSVPALGNLSAEQQKYIAIPHEEDGEYSKCSVYDMDFSSFSYEDLIKWNRSEMIGNSTTESTCSSWSFDTSEYNSIVNKWSLVCDRSYLVSLLQTVYMAGWLVGCVVYGQIADRYGRKKAMMAALVVEFVVCFAQVFVPVYQIYAVGRFLIGTCTGGFFTNMFVICMEIIGPKWRMETGIFVQGWFAIGIMLLSWVAWMLSDLFKLHLFLSLFLIIFIPYFWIIPESPRWLVSQGRYEEAEVILRKIAKFNKRPLPQKLVLSDEDDVHKVHKGFITDLFKGSRIRIITIAMWCAWFTASIDYYGLSLGVDILPGSTFINMFMSGLIELPSYLTACILLNKIGRRWPNSGTLIGSGVCCVLMAPFIASSSHAYLLTAFSMMGKFFCAAAFAIVYVYAAELFPTVVRNVGVGSSSMCARVAGLIQPQVQLTGTAWAPLPFIVYGACSLVAGVVSCFLPETLNKQLPETLEDVENFHNKPNLNEVSEDTDSSTKEPMMLSDATSEPASPQHISDQNGAVA